MTPDIKNERIEIKTLALEVGQAADDQLASAMNEDWEPLNFGATTVVVMGEVKHFEIIKLMRLIEDAPLAGGESTETAELPKVVVEETEKITSPPTARTNEDGADKIEMPLTGATVTWEKITPNAEKQPHPPTFEKEASPPAPLPWERGESGARVVRGTIISGAAAVGEREPVESVTFGAALASGKYSADELMAIGNREAQAAALNVVWQRQQYQQWTWDGFVARRPVLTA